MFSEYRDYILNIRNSLIRNGIELDIDPTDDYEELFYLGEGLGQILWLYNIFGRVGDDLALSDTLLPLNDTYDQKIRRRVFEKFCENEVDLRVANEGYNKDEIIDLWGTMEKEKPTEVVGTIENIPTTLKEKLSQMLNKISKQGSKVKEESEVKEDSKVGEKSDDRYISSDDFGDYEWIFERARAIESSKKAHDEGNKVSNSGSDEKVYVDIDDLLKTGDGWVCDMVGHKFVIERPVVFGGEVSDEKPTWDDSDDDWFSDPDEGSEEENSVEENSEEEGSEEEDQKDSDLFAEWDISDDEDDESDVDEGSESEDDFGDNWGDDDEDNEEDSSKGENGSTESSENDFSDWGSTEEDDDDFADWGSDDDENADNALDRWVDSSTGNTPTGFNSGSESRDTVRRSLSPEDLALEKEIARIDESVERVSNLISKGFSTLRKLPKKAMKDMGKTE